MTDLGAAKLRGLFGEGWPPADRPVLIAGPTASGKSALAMEIARAQGRIIVNADALQVWPMWRVLTARPTARDEAAVPHLLFGHLQRDADYSVGHWLRDVSALLAQHPNPVIVGGTGLFLSALTEGLAEIPPTPPEVRAEADRRRLRGDTGVMLSELDPATRGRTDPLNPMRIQRAWEVQRATGRGLAEWQDGTGAPVLALRDVTALCLHADRDWLAARIDRRFAAMLRDGAMDEARAVLPFWDPGAPWAKAIGAPELVAHLHGQISLEDAVGRAQAASRQYAKRQRTWFRARMRGWTGLVAD
jgi:tRNA dimethylallyltransferase